MPQAGPKEMKMHNEQAEQREKDERETFTFTEDQLVSTLERTIELYLIYSIASSEKPATDAAIIAVLQGLNDDQQLADLLERYPMVVCDNDDCHANFQLNGTWDITPSKQNTIRVARQRKWYIGKDKQFCSLHRSSPYRAKG